jgi:hypothetical protein
LVQGQHAPDHFGRELDRLGVTQLQKLDFQELARFYFVRKQQPHPGFGQVQQGQRAIPAGARRAVVAGYLGVPVDFAPGSPALIDRRFLWWLHHGSPTKL